MIVSNPHLSTRARTRLRLERQLDAIARDIPLLSRPLSVVRARGWWIMRLPIAVCLIAGGVLSILPFLGLWMLPVGLLLLAIDLPLLRAPISNAIVRGRRRVTVWRRKH